MDLEQTLNKIVELGRELPAHRGHDPGGRRPPGPALVRPLDMAGASLTLSKLDPEIDGLLGAPAESPSARSDLSVPRARLAPASRAR